MDTLSGVLFFLHDTDVCSLRRANLRSEGDEMLVHHLK